MRIALRPILLLVGVLVGVALTAAACGGSDDDGAATTDSGVTMPAAEDNSTDAASGDSTEEDSVGDDAAGEDSAGASPALAGAIESFEGIEIYTGLGRDHVENPTYDVRPPAGGDHLNQWESCGFFATEIDDGNAVHSLEHGAVWVTYRPDLDPASVSELESLANVETHLLVSPYPDLESPLVLVAWGLRLPLDDIEDERFDGFLETFIRGPQTPEPGVACRV